MENADFNPREMELYAASQLPCIGCCTRASWASSGIWRWTKKDQPCLDVWGVAAIT